MCGLYNYTKFHYWKDNYFFCFIVPNVNMDDPRDSIEYYKELLNQPASSLWSIDSKHRRLPYFQHTYKTFRRVKGLYITNFQIRVGSEKFNDHVYDEFLKINATNPIIRDLYTPSPTEETEFYDNLNPDLVGMLNRLE